VGCSLNSTPDDTTSQTLAGADVSEFCSTLVEVSSAIAVVTGGLPPT